MYKKGQKSAEWYTGGLKEQLKRGWPDSIGEVQGLEQEGTWCAKPKSFGFYLEWNADPPKDLKQGCEKSGVCFRNPILLVLGIWCDKGPGGEQGAQRRNSYRNSGDRGMFTQQP